MQLVRSHVVDSGVGNAYWISYSFQLFLLTLILVLRGSLVVIEPRNGFIDISLKLLFA